MSNIRTRLTLSHLAVIVLAMGLSGFLLLSFLEQYFLQATEDSLIAQARITAQTLIPNAGITSPEVEAQPPLSNIQQQASNNLYLDSSNLVSPETNPMDLDFLANASLQLGAQLNTRIRILDAAGLVLADSQQAQNGEDLSADSLIVQALKGNYASETRETSDGEMMIVALPVEADDQLISIVYLSQPLDDVTAVLRDLRWRWGTSTLIGLLFSMIAGFALSRAIIRPLRQLTAAAEAVAQGDLNPELQIKSRDEIGRLSKTFNYMTERLRIARQIQIDFVANVSHELRTPLTSIKGLIETLRDGAVDDPTVRDSFLETVESETDRLIRLVNDLLLLSRVDSDVLHLRRANINLAALMQNTLSQFAVQIHEKRLSVETAIPPELEICADEDRVRQVLVNVLDNAINYSELDGKINLSAEKNSDGLAAIKICDEGVGIPPHELTNIGQRFYRADKARSRLQGGSGLGLAIAIALVNAHGGKLWLTSRLGDGTTVNFTLPLPL